MPENVTTIITDIKDIASSILEKDISTIRGFSERQVEAIAKQTVLIQKGVENGDIDEDLREFFLDGLEAMALNFVNTLKGILMVTLEKLWNALVKFLYKAVGVVVDRKSTRLNSSHVKISYAVFCLKQTNRAHLRRRHRLLPRAG